MQETKGTWVQSLGWKDPIEEGMATHSSIVAWRIPWTEEPVRLQSTGSQRGGHDWSNLHAYTHYTSHNTQLTIFNKWGIHLRANTNNIVSAMQQYTWEQNLMDEGSCECRKKETALHTHSMLGLEPGAFPWRSSWNTKLWEAGTLSPCSNEDMCVCVCVCVRACVSRWVVSNSLWPHGL